MYGAVGLNHFFTPDCNEVGGLKRSPTVRGAWGTGGFQGEPQMGDDERLRVLLECWAELPESVKDAIRALAYKACQGTAPSPGN